MMNVMVLPLQQRPKSSRVATIAIEGSRVSRRRPDSFNMEGKDQRDWLGSRMPCRKSRYDRSRDWRVGFWANLQMWQAPGPRAAGAGWKESMVIDILVKDGGLKLLRFCCKIIDARVLSVKGTRPRLKR